MLIRIFTHALSLFLLTVSVSAWAASPPPEKAHLIHYHIEGLEGNVLQNTLAHLRAAEQSYEHRPLPALEKHLRRPNTLLRRAIAPYGYFHARVLSTRVLFQVDTFEVYYAIDPGPRARLHTLDLELLGEGQSDPVLQKIIQTFPLHSGDGFESEPYVRMRDALFTAATRRGYLDLKVIQNQIRIDEEKNKVDITLQVDTGRRYLFGDIHISENPIASSQLIRYARFKPGSPFAPTKVTEFQDALSGSGYFKHVRIKSNKTAAVNGRIPLFVDLKPRKQQLYTFGAGYGTDTRLRGTLGWDWRWVNDHGDSFSALLSASQVQNQLTARYVIPGKQPQHYQYNLTAGLQTLDLDKGQSFTSQIGASYIKNFSNWRRTVGLTLQRDLSKRTGINRLYTTFLLPNISWLRMYGDKPFFPSEGRRINILLQGASKDFMSETNFVQAHFQAKVIHKFGDRFRLLTRGDLGMTEGDRLDTLPLSLQFFTGGSQSIRGFSYQSIGPGHYLLQGSVEAQMRIISNWHAATFYDIGSAFNEFPVRMKRGTGVGLVYLSPIGAIQVNYARALSEPRHPWRVHFSLGPDL